LAAFFDILHVVFLPEAFGGTDSPGYLMYDDYSYALGDIYLCDLALHVTSWNNRVVGVAPTWCAIENRAVTSGERVHS